MSKQSVVEALQDFPAGVCTRCLQEITGISTAQQIRNTTIELEREGRASRDTVAVTKCSKCGEARKLNRPSIMKIKAEPAEHSAKPDRVRIEDLDELRRLVIRYLDLINPSSLREGYGARIARLRNEGKLTPILATLLIAHATYRNAVTYDAFEISEEESKLLRHMDLIIRGMIAKNA